MIWDLYQQNRIAGAERAADRASSKAERHTNHIDDLQQHVERLSLASQAMWELVKHHSAITDDDLESKMLEIDARDGRIDGKINTQPISCPSCGRTTSSRRDTCMVCGAPTKRVHPFEG